jgi:hypothetical protein
MIGGNTEALLQRKDGSTVSVIGERIHHWADVQILMGWLDLMNGDSKYRTFNAKIQESTHVFLCNYVSIDRKADDKRLMIHGVAYDILLIDDPMELHQQLEIYLRYVG